MRRFQSRDGSVTFEEDDRTMSVWLVRDADDYRAQHDFIAVERGEEVTYYEPVGWTSEGPVERVLAVAGFRPAGPLPLRVERPSPDTPVVKLRGFVVPEGKEAEIPMMLHRALVGSLGGFHPVVMMQTGFHRAPLAFEMLWSAAGCPPILTRHPDMIAGPPGGEGHARIGEAADRSGTLVAIRAFESDDDGGAA